MAGGLGTRFGLRGATFRWGALLALIAAGAILLHLRPKVARFDGRTMGTTYSVALGVPLSRGAAAGLQRAVEARLAELNAVYSTHDPSSEVSRFNRHASTAPFPASAALAEVVRLALQVSRASGGAFDVTVAPLVDAWGFGPVGRPGRAPTDAELDALRDSVGFEKLRLDGSTLIKAHPRLRIDLSAIAKGHAVDEIAALLEARGVRRYLVEIGGEMRAFGHNREGHPFRVGIEEPDPSRRAVRLAIGLSRGALATSGNYRNAHELGGVHAVHTIDPATGRPKTSRLLSASVLHARCALADAWATALMAAGPDRAWELARAAGLEVLLLVSGEGGRIEERATPGFAALRLRR